MITLILQLAGAEARASLLEDATTVARVVRRLPPVTYPTPRAARLDPNAWLDSIRRVCAEVAEADPDRWRRMDAVSFSCGRSSFVWRGPDDGFVGDALDWTDRSGLDAPVDMTTDEYRARTGVIFGAGTVYAKAMAMRTSGATSAIAGLATPRDVLAHWLTDAPWCWDAPTAARSGCYTRAGEVVDPSIAQWLPAVLPAATVIGHVTARASAETGIPQGVPVVLGSGDRANEAVAVGGGWQRMLVSMQGRVVAGFAVADGEGSVDWVVTPHPLRGGFVERGTSGGDPELLWLAALTRTDPDALMTAAMDVEPGAAGILALPLLTWHPDPSRASASRGAVFGMSLGHTDAHLARSYIDAFVLDLAEICASAPERPEAVVATVVPFGRDAWARAVADATGLPVVRTRDEPSAVGAAMIAAVALGGSVAPSTSDDGEVTYPEPASSEAYAELLAMRREFLGDTEPSSSPPARVVDLTAERSAKASASPLSRREFEVLTLAASGMADSEIAAALFVSRRTVGTHLANIYRKLGVRGRGAASAWYHAHVWAQLSEPGSA